MYSGGFKEGKGVQMHPVLKASKGNLRLLYSSFGFVPIIIFSLQR